MKNYNKQKFTTGGYTEYFKSIILNFPGFQKFKKMNGSYLDIGCGHFKEFSFTGIDISEPNIYTCNEALSNLSDCLRFDFILDDFIEHKFNRKFFLAFSYSVFQLMDTSIDEFAEASVGIARTPRVSCFEYAL